MPVIASASCAMRKAGWRARRRRANVAGLQRATIYTAVTYDLASSCARRTPRQRCSRRQTAAARRCNAACRRCAEAAPAALLTAARSARRARRGVREAARWKRSWRGQTGRRRPASCRLRGVAPAKSRRRAISSGRSRIRAFMRTARRAVERKWHCGAGTELAKICRLARIIAMQSLGGSRSLKFLTKKGISEIGRRRTDDDAKATCPGGADVGKFVVLFRATGLLEAGPGPVFDQGFAYHVV